MDKLNNVYLIFTGGHAWFGALVEGEWQVAGAAIHHVTCRISSRAAQSDHLSN
jgi:hypothetical protein